MLEKKNLKKLKIKRKHPPIGKPKRGGSKKFYVYVKILKVKKLKKYLLETHQDYQLK
jgi:hypothetical protein